MITGSISLPFSHPAPLFTYPSLVGPTFMMLLMMMMMIMMMKVMIMVMMMMMMMMMMMWIPR